MPQDKSSSSSLQVLGHAPYFEVYHPRKEDQPLQLAIIKLCLKQTGFLAIVGESGIGKTSTLAAALCTQRSSFLHTKCPQFKRLLWINDSGNYRDIVCEIARLLEVEIEQPFVGTDYLEDWLACSLHDAEIANVLVVVDNLRQAQTLRQLTKLQRYLRFIVVPKAESIVEEVFEDDHCSDVFKFSVMLDTEVQKMLAETYKMSPAFQPSQLRELAHTCRGLPFLAKLIQGFMAKCIIPEVSCQKLLKFRTEIAKQPWDCYRDCLIDYLFCSHFDSQNAQYLPELAAFLLYEAEAAVPLEDLAVTWAIPLEQVVPNLREKFVSRGLVKFLAYKLPEKDEPTSFRRTFIRPEPILSHALLPALVRKSALKLLQASKQDIAQLVADKSSGALIHSSLQLDRFKLLNCFLEKAKPELVYSLLPAIPADLLNSKTLVPCLVAVDRILAGDFGLAMLESFAQIPSHKLFFIACEYGLFHVALNLFPNLELADPICLLAACQNGHAKIVTLLLEVEIPLDSFDGNDRTCLHLAAKGNHVSVVKQLLRHEFLLKAVDIQGQTALMLAAERGHRRVVELLLHAGSDVNAQDSKGSTALMLAAGLGYQTIVTQLLMKEANPDVQNLYGDTALTLAAKNGHPKVVKVLLQSSSHPNMTNQQRKTALYLAVEYRREEVVKALLLQKVDPDFKCFNKRTPLMLAAELGAVAIAVLLLGNGAQINAKETSKGQTALHLAVAKGQLVSVKLLISRKADVNARDSNYHTPLMLSVAGDEAISRSLLDNGADVNACDRAGVSVLMMACEHDNETLVLSLLEKGANPSHQSNFGDTPLLVAAKANQLNILNHLFDNHANPQLKNARGESVLTAAIQLKHEEMVRLCLDRGAVPVIDDPLWNDNHDTPLMLAVSSCDSDAIPRTLFKKGCNAKVSNRLDLQALHLATSLGFVKVVRAILERDIREDSQEWIKEAELVAFSQSNNAAAVQKLVEQMMMEPGSCRNLITTPLLEACRRGSFDVAKFLLAKAADVNHQHKLTKETALMISAERGDYSMVKLLLSFKANTELEDDWGSTALFKATKNQHREIVKVLLESQAHPSVYALTQASYLGNFDILRLLLEHGAQVNEKLANNGRTALMEAAEAGYEDALILLLENGAMVEERDSNGDSALLLGVRRGFQNIVERLLQEGAEVCRQSLVEMVRFGKPYLASLLARGEDGQAWSEEAQLLHAVVHGEKDDVERLMGNGVSPDTSLNGHDTALSLACSNNQLDMARILIKAGADVNRMNGNGCLPLNICAAEGFEDLCILLLDNGADPLLRDSSGRNAIQFAVEHLRHDCLQVLIKRVQENHANWLAEIQLLQASFDGNLNLVRKLVEEDKQIEADSCLNGKLTALMLAAGQGHLALVEYLLPKKMVEEALEVSIKLGNERIVSLFISNCKFDKTTLARCLFKSVGFGTELITLELVKQLSPAADSTTLHKALKLAEILRFHHLCDVLAKHIGEEPTPLTEQE